MKVLPETMVELPSMVAPAVQKQKSKGMSATMAILVHVLASSSTISSRREHDPTSHHHW